MWMVIAFIILMLLLLWWFYTSSIEKISASAGTKLSMVLNKLPLEGVGMTANQMVDSDGNILVGPTFDVLLLTKNDKNEVLIEYFLQDALVGRRKGTIETDAASVLQIRDNSLKTATGQAFHVFEIQGEVLNYRYEVNGQPLNEGVLRELKAPQVVPVPIMYPYYPYDSYYPYHSYYSYYPRHRRHWGHGGHRRHRRHGGHRRRHH